MWRTKNESDGATLPWSKHRQRTVKTMNERSLTAALVVAVVHHRTPSWVAWGILERVQLRILRNEDRDRDRTSTFNRRVHGHDHRQRPTNWHSWHRSARRVTQELERQGRRKNNVLRVLLDQRKSKSLSELVTNLESLVLELLAEMMSLRTPL